MENLPESSKLSVDHAHGCHKRHQDYNYKRIHIVLTHTRILVMTNSVTWYTRRVPPTIAKLELQHTHHSPIQENKGIRVYTHFCPTKKYTLSGTAHSLTGYIQGQMETHTQHTMFSVHIQQVHATHSHQYQSPGIHHFFVCVSSMSFRIEPSKPATPPPEEADAFFFLAATRAERPPAPPGFTPAPVARDVEGFDGFTPAREPWPPPTPSPGLLVVPLAVMRDVCRRSTSVDRSRVLDVRRCGSATPPRVLLPSAAVLLPPEAVLGVLGFVVCAEMLAEVLGRAAPPSLALPPPLPLLPLPRPTPRLSLTPRPFISPALEYGFDVLEALADGRSDPAERRGLSPLLLPRSPLTVRRLVLLPVLTEALGPEFEEERRVGLPDRPEALPISRAAPLPPRLFCNFLVEEETELLDTGATAYLGALVEPPPLRVLPSPRVSLRSALEPPEGCESRRKEEEPALGAEKAAGGGAAGSRGCPSSVTVSPPSRGAFAALLRSSSC